jgi:CRP/FNR family transcriptional regulator, cyclic AMP receptor protein
MVMTMAIDASRLRVSPVFEGLTDEELERSAALFEEVELLAGSSMIKEGDFSYRFFVVLDGEVDVTHHFDPVRRLGPGEICGEIGLLTGQRRTARVVAHTRCKLASLMTWDFRTLMEQAPAAARKIEAIAEERLAANEATTPDADAS